MDNRLGIEVKDESKELLLLLNLSRIDRRTIDRSIMIFDWDILKELAETLQDIVNKKPDYEKFIIKLT